MQALRAIWKCWATGEPLHYQGEHYQFTLMTPNFTPQRIESPDILGYVSALGPGMARPAVEEGARRAGRKLEDVELLWGGFSATGFVGLNQRGPHAKPDRDPEGPGLTPEARRVADWAPRNCVE